MTRMKDEARSIDLDPQRIVAAAERLAARIHERMPSRQLSSHARAFADHAARVISTGPRAVAVPTWIRVASWAGGFGALLILLSPFMIVRKLDGIDVLPEFLQALDSSVTTFAATVAGFFTMRSISDGHRRRQALEGLHRLRAFVHVTEMLQANKSPARLIFRTRPTASSPELESDVGTLGSYLCYSAELAALIAKIATMYGKWAPDPMVMATLDDIEDRCSELELKIGQKMLLLERVNAAGAG